MEGGLSVCSWWGMDSFSRCVAVVMSIISLLYLMLYFSGISRMVLYYPQQ